MSEFPHCTVCQAPISLRATNCAVCDAPAPPLKQVIPSGEIRSGEWVRFKRPPAELKDLYTEVVHALAPNIRVLGMAGEGGMALVFVGRDMTLKREVAVKLLAPALADDEVARKRFVREAEAIAYVNARPRPLALYVFDHDKPTVDRVLNETVSGGATVNETLLHIAQEDLPFGGVGPSGMGEYHGRAGFDTFSKRKAVFFQPRLNLLGLFRPPYGPTFERLMKILARL